MPISEVEQRSYVKGELRAQAGFVLEGRAASFGVLSRDLGGFKERCVAGCFSRSLAANDDVFCLLNHAPDNVLSRRKSGTLKLWEASDGLHFRAQLDPKNTFHTNTYAAVQRGDFDSCSFGFIVNKGGESWKTADDGSKLRELRDVKLVDVSVVAYPAYEQTAVAARSRAHQPTAAELKASARQWRKNAIERAKRLGLVILRDRKLADEENEEDYDIENERAAQELQGQLRDGLELIHVSSLDKNGCGHAYAVDMYRSEPDLFEIDYEAEPDNCEPSCRYWYHARVAGDVRKLTAVEVSSMDGRMVATARETHRMHAPTREMRARISSAAR